MAATSIIEKIEALLRKAEATEFEAEAAAFWEKAQALMIQHAVDEQMLKTGGIAAAEPIVKLIDFSKNDAYIPAKTALISAVARNNRVKLMFHAGADRQTAYFSAKGKRTAWTVSMIGFADDVEFAQILYASLTMQALAGARRERLGKAQTTAFMMGFAVTVNDRMVQVNTKVTDAGGSSTALALRDRDAVVRDKSREMFPNAGTMRTSSGRGDFASSAMGRAAGASADISGGRNNVGRGVAGALGR